MVEDMGMLEDILEDMLEDMVFEGNCLQDTLEDVAGGRRTPLQAITWLSFGLQRSRAVQNDQRDETNL